MPEATQTPYKAFLGFRADCAEPTQPVLCASQRSLAGECGGKFNRLVYSCLSVTTQFLLRKGHFKRRLYKHAPHRSPFSAVALVHASIARVHARQSRSLAPRREVLDREKVRKRAVQSAVKGRGAE